MHSIPVCSDVFDINTDTQDFTSLFNTVAVVLVVLEVLFETFFVELSASVFISLFAFTLKNFIRSVLIFSVDGQCHIQFGILFQFPAFHLLLHEMLFVSHQQIQTPLSLPILVIVLPIS